MKLPLRVLSVFILFANGIALFLAFPAKAMSDAHQQGMSLANSIPLPPPGRPENVPGYAGADLSQSQIGAHDLGAAAGRTARDNEAAKLLSDTADTREKYVIDPHTDPLILEASKIISDPKGAMEEDVGEEKEGKDAFAEIKNCEESGEETLESVEEIREVTVAEPAKHHSVLRVYSHGWGGGLARNVITGQKLDGSTTATTGYAANTMLLNPLPADLQNRVKGVELSPDYARPYCVSLSSSGVVSVSTGGGGGWSFVQTSVLVDIILKPGEENVSENIVNNGHYLDDQVEKGLCSYEEIQVTEGPQTRVINDYPVTRDWWRRKMIYRCHYPAKNDCEALRARGCYQVHSACKENVRGVCVIWAQTYQCPSGKVSGKSYRSSNRENPFCLSGDCADKSFEPNQDFVEVMSHMSVLKEAGADLRSFGTIFKGHDRRCTRHCVNFKDCCGNGRGWGMSFHLASCDADEKELAELRKKNRCIQVGTYCAEKLARLCIRKKTTFCCYGTKLAKIIQEQGKGQLGLGFGDPEHPQCQGLTPEELSRIDFSRVNFSDIFSEIVTSTKSPNPEAMMKGIQKSMADKGSLLNVKEKEAKPSLLSPKGASSPIPNETQGRANDQF